MVRLTFFAILLSIFIAHVENAETSDDAKTTTPEYDYYEDNNAATEDDDTEKIDVGTDNTEADNDPKVDFGIDADSDAGTGQEELNEGADDTTMSSTPSTTPAAQKLPGTPAGSVAPWDPMQILAKETKAPASMAFGGDDEEKSVGDMDFDDEDDQMQGDAPANAEPSSYDDLVETTEKSGASSVFVQYLALCAIIVVFV